MSILLLDTHFLAWLLIDDPKFQPNQRQIAQKAQSVAISTISIYEITRKANLGKWPAMEPHLDLLPKAVETSGLQLLPITNPIAHHAGRMNWTNKDPFDRLIAATAILHNAALLTLDRKMQSLENLDIIS